MAGYSSKVSDTGKLIAHPLTFLIVQGVLILTVLTCVHGVRTDIVGDAQSYIHFNWASLSDVLGQTRTFGYPLLLCIVGFFSPDLTMLPQVQILFFVASVVFLHPALRVYGFSTWGAFIACSALLYQRTLWDLATGTYSDLPALSLAVIAIACLLKITAQGRSIGSWPGLVVCTFLAYQMRPAYLFLIGLAPVLGVILSIVREPLSQEPGRWQKLLTGLLVASIVPFLAFASLRWAVVGHFGLVSFGALNLTGITTQFMTKEMVDKFDADLQPLALAIIESRDRTGLAPPDGHRMWPLVDFCSVFSRTLTQVVIPTSLMFLTQGDGRSVKSGHRDISSVTGPETMRLNRVAQRLSWSTIRARPFPYALYCVKSFAYQISFMLYVNATISALLILLFGAHLFVAIQEKRLPNAANSALWNDVRPPRENVSPLVFLSGLFFLANLLLTTFVTPPFGRYLLAASVFIPSALAVALLEVVERAYFAGRMNEDVT